MKNKQYQGHKLVDIIEKNKQKYANLKTENKKVSATIEKYKAEYSKLKVEQEETTTNLMSSKEMWDEYSKRINKLESENKNFRSILCWGSNEQSLTFIDPQEMHKKIRYLESQLMLT